MPAVHRPTPSQIPEVSSPLCRMVQSLASPETVPIHTALPRSLLPLPEISAPRNAFLLPRLLFFSLHFQLRLGLRLFLFVLIVKPTGPQTEMIKHPVDDLHFADRGRLPPQAIQPLHHRNVVDRLLARFNQPTCAALSQRSQNVRFCHGTLLSVPNRVPHPQCQCQCQVPSAKCHQVPLPGFCAACNAACAVSLWISLVRWLC